MVRKVRFLPPLAVAACLALGAFRPAGAQEGGGSPPVGEPIRTQARVLQELQRRIEERRQELARQEEALEALRRALDEARKALEAERERLEALKREVEADIARRERVIDERLDQIAKVYGAMKPREAAKALEGLADDMAVAILERLPGRTVGKIFNLMDKDRVRELTRRLEEGRSKPPPKSPARSP